MIGEMRAGGRWIVVEESKVGRKIGLRFRNYGPLREEIKCMRGAEWKHDLKLWSVTDCPRNRKQLALLRGETVPEFERYYTPTLDGAPERDLWDHQRAMLGHLLERRRCILAAEMRTGKTLAVIEAMEHVGGSWLYVAPAKVLTAIEIELEKWQSKVTPALVSYAMLRKTLERWEGPAPLGVVFDESSRLKTPSAQRSKAALHLAKAVRDEHDGYVFLLTGTPAPKAPTDWWSQAEIACPGFLRESSVSHLERRCAELERVTYGDQTFAKVVGWKEDEVELLGRRLTGLVQVHLLKDCMDLPPVRYEKVVLSVSESTRRAARMLAAQAESPIQALSALRQLSDGFQYTDSGTVTATCPKDAALEQILGEHEESGRLVIFAGFHASVDRCTDIARGAGWDVLQCDGRGWVPPEDKTTKEALREMDRATTTGTGRLCVVAHPGSGGMGLTYSASRGIVFYSSDFNGESRRQAEARCAGSNAGYTIYDLLHLETDSLVLTNLQRKKALESLTLEEIHACLT